MDLDSEINKVLLFFVRGPSDIPGTSNSRRDLRELRLSSGGLLIAVWGVFVGLIPVIFPLVLEDSMIQTHLPYRIERINSSLLNINL